MFPLLGPSVPLGGDIQESSALGRRGASLGGEHEEPWSVDGSDSWEPVVELRSGVQAAALRAGRRALSVSNRREPERRGERGRSVTARARLSLPASDPAPTPTCCDGAGRAEEPAAEDERATSRRARPRLARGGRVPVRGD